MGEEPGKFKQTPTAEKPPKKNEEGREKNVRRLNEIQGCGREK